MNIPQQLIAAYGALVPTLKAVESRVSETLLSYSRDRLLPFVARVKTIESAAEKIETGRYRSFSEIDDLVAFTLVVPTLKEDEEAISYCQNVFRISDIKLRSSAKKSPDVFRFDATRMYGFLARPQGSELDDNISIYDIKFEIQIRTAFEHAWIVATHPLTYKTDDVNWKRSRLAAQLKASTEQLDLAVLQFESLAQGIVEAPWPEFQEKQKVIKLIVQLRAENVIPIEAQPKDLSRFADNLIRLFDASKTNVNVDGALHEIEAGLRGFSADTFPMSASLLQVCIGVLCRNGTVAGPFSRYSCHITEQLVQLFPDARSLSPVFRYGA